MEGTDEQKKQKYERNKAEFEKRKQQQQCFMCTMDVSGGKTKCKWVDCPHHGTAASPAMKMKHVVPGYNGPRHAGGTA